MIAHTKMVSKSLATWKKSMVSTRTIRFPIRDLRKLTTSGPEPVETSVDMMSDILGGGDGGMGG